MCANGYAKPNPAKLLLQENSFKNKIEKISTKMSDTRKNRLFHSCDVHLLCIFCEKTIKLLMVNTESKL